MSLEYSRILSGEKVKCDSCGKGYIEPTNKNVPVEKANCFKCSHCERQINITRKLKI